jgi:hypothetical protein
MSERLIAILVSFVMLISVGFALTIMRSQFVSSDRIYPIRIDFDQAFGEFVTTVDSKSIAANREKVRRAGLERLNLE